MWRVDSVVGVASQVCVCVCLDEGVRCEMVIDVLDE